MSGSLLYLRFRAFDPDRLLSRLVRKVRFFFTPQFVTLSAALILLAIGTTVTQWNEISGDFGRLYQVSAIPLIVLTVFLVVALHEFAHGLTCKHFGGEVHEMGFLLMYFQPAFYCNVSDAWLFPEKSRRLWVGFAGPYFELFLWAVATLVWRVTEVDTGINYLALIVMMTSGIKTLFNFNPLIKLDGYYLLSDYLAIPNLRARSFRYIGDRLKSLTGPALQAMAGLTARERRIYLSYGLVAAVWSFCLLSLVIVQTGGFLIEQNEPMGLLLFAGVLGTKVGRRFGRLFRRSSASADPAENAGESDSSEATAPVEAARSRVADRAIPQAD